jgi:hypothetical protein
MDSFLNPNSGVLSGHKPMLRVPEVEYFDSIEDLYKYGSKQGAIGAYKPVKILPSKRINTNAKMPIVFNAGDIVSIKSINPKASYTADDAVTGILNSGDIYYTIDESGVARKVSIDAYYEEQIAGLIVPANGSSGSVNLSYTDACGDNGIILSDGSKAAVGSAPYANAANIPAGIVDSAVYSDMAHRWLNYDFEQRAIGITRGGILMLPYIGLYSSTGSDITAATTAIQAAIDKKHQYALFTGANANALNALLVSGSYLKPNAYGKFVPWVSGTDDNNLIFGEVLSTANRYPYAYNDIKDTFPGNMIEGTDTGGLSKRMYDLVSTVAAIGAVKPTDYSTSKVYTASLIGTPKATATTGLTIVFGRIEVAFGTAVKS